MRSNDDNDDDDQRQDRDVKIGIAKRSHSSDDDEDDEGARHVTASTFTSRADDDEKASVATSPNQAPSKNSPWTAEQIDQARSLDLEGQQHDIANKGDGGVYPNKSDSAMSSSAAAAARAIVASEIGTISEPKQRGRRPRSTVPGAEHVQSRAPGLSSTFLLNMMRRQREASAERAAPEGASPIEGTLQEFAVVANVHEYSQSDDATAKRRQQQRRYTVMGIAIVACLLLIGVAVGLGVGISANKGNKSNHTAEVNGTSQFNKTSQFSPFSKDCSSLTSQQYPHVISQCQCTGNISIVPDDIAARYQVLSATFIPTVFSDFTPSLDSCHPRNQALVWLASGDGETTVAATTTTDVSRRQRYSLALLFVLWNGLNWEANNGWLSSTDECTWFGVTCEGQVLVDISLTSNNLVGPLSRDIVLLSNLTSLSLDRNDFQGSTIPSEFGTMSNLHSISMPSAQINGTIPTELFQLGHILEYFQVDKNNLSGTISTLVGKLSKLTHWVVAKNEFTGTIPTEIGLCTYISLLEVSENHLNGTIPSQVGQMDSLVIFSVNDNHLSGIIPTELGSCALLRYIQLGNNNLTGTIPSQLGSLAYLENLNIDGNQLNGTTPNSVCQKGKCIGCNCTSP